MGEDEQKGVKRETTPAIMSKLQVLIKINKNYLYCFFSKYNVPSKN